MRARSFKPAIALLALAAAGGALSLRLLGARLDAVTGLSRDVFEGPGFGGAPLASARDRAVDLEFLDEVPALPRRFVSVRWDGYWYLPRAAAVDIYAGADDRTVVRIDEAIILERDTAAVSHTTSQTISLDAGIHHLRIEYEQFGGDSFLNVQWAPLGGAPRPFPSHSLFATTPRQSDLDLRRLVILLRRATAGLWLVLAGLVAWPMTRVPLSRAARHAGTRWRSWRQQEPIERLRGVMAGVGLDAVIKSLDAQQIPYRRLSQSNVDVILPADPPARAPQQ